MFIIIQLLNKHKDEMGIPYYFKYLIQNTPQIIQNTPAVNGGSSISLFLDSNSIVYDVVRDLEQKYDKTPETMILEAEIILQVVFRIHEYIAIIHPNHTVYISFDGVAPLSKMTQQRSRRLKSALQSNNNNSASFWNTANITPGTPFMKSLSAKIREAFAPHQTKTLGVKTLIVSTADEIGEGEHKIFHHLRQHPAITAETVFVYGLDADLIMLSILHSTPNRRLWVFREEPAFQLTQTSQKQQQQQQMLYLDVEELNRAIIAEMTQQTHTNNSQTHQNNSAVLLDYVFLCFFLGNDFLPHFPSLNIRTHGIPALMELYRTVCGCGGNGDDGGGFIQEGKIHWKTVEKFIHQCSCCEHEWLLQEYNVRQKMQENITRQRRHPPQQDDNDQQYNIPVLYRGEELYIAPEFPFWQHRYYETLFGGVGSDNPKNIAKICRNYLEGLAWVFAYYTGECTDWRWTYDYHYPPLWTDLHKHFQIPTQQHINNPAFTQEQQLEFVMPPSNLNPEKYHYQWSFCRYFWEAHIHEKNK